MLHYFDNISLIVSVCCDCWINIAIWFMIFLKILFTYILHAKAAAYVMAASIYSLKYWDKE